MEDEDYADQYVIVIISDDEENDCQNYAEFSEHRLSLAAQVKKFIEENECEGSDSEDISEYRLNLIKHVQNFKDELEKEHQKKINCFCLFHLFSMY